MKRLIKWLLLITVVVVIGPAIILFNPLLIKTPLEQLLGKISGHDLSLNEELHLSVGKEVHSFVQTEGQDGLLNVNLDATFNDRLVNFDDHIGTVTNIIKGHDVSFDGKGQFGPIKVSGSGLIDDLIPHP